jgi:hypothetical protein
MSKKKIGFVFSGPIASGKTFNASKISEMLQCRHLSFATPIKQITQLLEANFPEINPTKAVKNRKLYQTIGQGFKSIMSENIWTNKLLKDIEFGSNNEMVVIDDMRYDNEYNSLKLDISRKWYFIYLAVPQLTRLERIKKLYPQNWRDHLKHDTLEIPINKFDFVAYTSKSIESYVLKIIE